MKNQKIIVDILTIACYNYIYFNQLENMLVKHEFFVFKLITSESLLAVIVGEDDDTLTFAFPLLMTIKGNPLLSLGEYWCPYTSDQIFTIFKSDLIFVKPLDANTEAYYKKTVDMKRVNATLEALEGYNDNFSEEYDDITMENITIH